MTENHTPQAIFVIEKIYLKDASYEAPGAPGVFQQSQGSEIEVQITLGHRPLDAAKGFYDVELSLQISAKREGKAVFVVDVHQAGVFRVEGITGEALERTLEITCGYVLLPFAREAICDLIGKGGFPQLLIAPINFDALYEQKRAAVNQPAQGRA